MKIALCSIGSRGDIQPFLTVGEYLAKHEHEVKVSSAKMYEKLASAYAVNYVPFEGNYESIMDNEALKKEIGKNPFKIKGKLKEKVYPIIENSLDTYYELLQWCDVMLYHPKTLIDSIGKEHQYKLIKGYVVPAFTPTKEFKNPLFEVIPLPKFLNKITYKIINSMIGAVKTPVNNFKKRNQLPKSKAFIETPIIYGISPSLLSIPKDYPENHHYSGFWIKEKSTQELTEEISDFISGDKKILAITFGSMPYQSQIDINDFIEVILKENDIKLILIKAWGLKNMVINPHKNLLTIDSAPFDVLFPKVDYVMHHGGAGTTAIAVSAGVTQFICPVLHPVGDQYFWGKQLKKMGVGVHPIPLKKLTIANLLSSITKLQKKKLTTEAQNLKQKIEMEDGLAETLRLIEQHGNQIRKQLL